MSLVIAAVLIIGGLVTAAIVAVGVPVVLGLMAYDVTARPRHASVATEDAATVEKARGRIVLQRGIARAFVIVGGAFWGIATAFGVYSYSQTGSWSTMLAAFIPFVATAATLIVGWYYERFTAALLILGVAGVVYLGVVNQFEAGMWMLTTIALIGPMVTASALFWMARREQEALDVLLARRPELLPAVAVSASGPIV